MELEDGFLSGFLNIAELEKYFSHDYELDTFRDIKPFQPVQKSKTDCERFNELPANEFINWSNYPQTQRVSDMSSIRRLQTAPREEIVFFNVQKCYEKVQCRKNKKSKQRVQGATINLRVTTDAPISRVEVFVERLPKAAVLCGDSNGRVPLKTKLENLMYSDNYLRQDQYFSVDLDSVYHNPLTGSPVYKLSTVDSERRNRFWLVAHIVYNGNLKSQPFYSEPFLLKSKRSSRSSPY
ncbi:hypothetical protein P5673_027111 [Acropora cervicornis]|uniref:Uncharacterized protein n=1 Tax=Acropora cervicornis TaxID=6130 RepID=A0AAD9PZV1_ACRCE|nr:hypothetical protein P5673_027111 [Acropora cervicornis]